MTVPRSPVEGKEPILPDPRPITIYERALDAVVGHLLAWPTAGRDEVRKATYIGDACAAAIEDVATAGALAENHAGGLTRQVDVEALLRVRATLLARHRQGGKRGGA